MFENLHRTISLLLSADTFVSSYHAHTYKYLPKLAMFNKLLCMLYNILNYNGPFVTCNTVPIKFVHFTEPAVECPSLTDPNNGVMTCSLEDDGVSSYKDTCSFTCNTGYELTGSDTRTCQSDGNWSGSDTMCSGGG